MWVDGHEILELYTAIKSLNKQVDKLKANKEKLQLENNELKKKCLELSNIQNSVIALNMKLNLTQEKLVIAYNMLLEKDKQYYGGLNGRGNNHRISHSC